MTPSVDESEAACTSGKALPVVCFSHLRWNFVYQRPQHLLTRAAAQGFVYFVEEPIFVERSEPELHNERQASGIEVLTPLLPRGREAESIEIQRTLLDRFLEEREVTDFVAWYYTPMAFLFSSHLRPVVTVYDCMDQLSAFQGAPPAMVEQEQQLLERANVVFTGGRSLYEAKRGLHANVHAFPSSVDKEHFGASRSAQSEPADQADIPHPRIGFFGVLDERLDRDLLREVAAQEPTWHFVLIGPVVKIREEELPHAPNIHYLGQKQYSELPSYIAHWDVAMLPFAMNESTRFISPTKTPEYLSAGKPVVSTPVHDVVEPYGRMELARIARDVPEFRAAIRDSLGPQQEQWLARVDEFLRHISWDLTFQGMWREVLRARAGGTLQNQQEVLVDV